MNRIYQGRVSSVELLDEGGVPRSVPIGDPSSCPLWQHHVIFQDAVNYYLVALGALASNDSENRVIRDLRQRLAEVWTEFPGKKPGASSLRDSLRRSLPALAADSTIDAAFDVVLAGNEAPGACRTAALALLLAQCGGEAAIQQGGRGYLPRFCDPAYSGSWDCDATATAAASGKEKLAAVLHSDASQEELEALAAEMSLAWTIKLQPGKSYRGDEAKARLTEAIQHLINLAEFPPDRLRAAIGEIRDDPVQVLRDLLATVSTLPDELEIARNRKAAPDLTFATITFKQFPNRITQRFLRLGVKAPAKAAVAKAVAKNAAARGTTASFAFDGDDPVKLARGRRGYVFPAFTGLPVWQLKSAGAPAWKEFDIAAFKEALKAVNQFNQKTTEREQNLRKAEQLFHWLIGEVDAPPAAAESEEAPPNRLGKHLWQLVGQLEAELSIHLNEGGWKVTSRSLRGFRDIRELWNKETDSSTEKLQDLVKQYQADDKHRQEIGSVQLFLKLAEAAYHDLWRQPEDDEGVGEGDPPDNPLRLAVEIHQLEDEIERCRQPIRLTPAEPRHSRRLFMFSDIKDKLAKVKFGTAADPATGDARSWMESAIAVSEATGIREARVRLHYTAPRLNRDQLTGGAESRWLQPMTAALGLEQPETLGPFYSACSLMPDHGECGVRHLLNFPVTLDPSWIHRSIGKAARWNNQFNGTRDNKLHLHWPGTAKDAAKKNGWWENPDVIHDGFTLLAADLGQRTAAAWSLIRVTANRPQTSRPCRSIGTDGAREWFAEIVRTGMCRLPGEEQRVLVAGEWTTERYGERGRPATEEEYLAAIGLAGEFGAEEPAKWMGARGEQTGPERNDTLLRLASRRLTRLGSYHRWSCFRPEQLDEGKRADAVTAQIAELESYQDEDVKGMCAVLASGDCNTFRDLARDCFNDLRGGLAVSLVKLADRVCPLRGRRWEWQLRGDGSPYGDLMAVSDPESHPKIRGQRGLAMVRIEQLENLRRLFLRYNRSLDRAPGEPAKFGREDKGRESGEPCQDLLDKLDRMKEERVNQTAHLILAQALGVRLKPHTVTAGERAARDLHGEYECIPRRQPVDFIVIEDLGRYRSSQGRAPSENSRLMKWAHRAVRDKLVMLAEEPFGIPVVEVAPAYSSRFHATSGEAGGRLHELPGLMPYQLAGLERTAKNSEKKVQRETAGELLSQFAMLARINAARASEGNGGAGKPPRTLYYPKAGGPLFLAAKSGKPAQADMNAACNLGLRAIAAPECLAILRRVRALKGAEGVYHARTDNAREKAAFARSSPFRLLDTPSKILAAAASPNFFHDPDGIAAFDVADLDGQRLVSGVALWSTVNESVARRCVELNRERLAAWELPVLQPEPDDEIPM